MKTYFKTAIRFFVAEHPEIYADVMVKSLYYNQERYKLLDRAKEKLKSMCEEANIDPTQVTVGQKEVEIDQNRFA